MQSLVVSRSKHFVPPEAVAEMAPQGMRELAWELISSGKVEQLSGFAGQPAGGGVLNLGSLEELDGIMATYPFGPITATKVYPLVDLDCALGNALGAIQQMASAHS